MFKKRFISMLVLLMTAVTGAWATITVTWNNDDITGSGTSFTKDGVTITAGYIDFPDKSFQGGGTFTTTLGNFTKIEVTTGGWYAYGTGWSDSDDVGTWTGNASSVSFSGDIYGYGYGTTKLVFTIEPPTVAVTGVTLAPTSATLTLGETETMTLIPTVLPDDATDKTVTWTTSNASVATVTDGVVTAVAAGTATITVTTTDGAKTATCAVTVAAPAASTYTVTLKEGTEDATSWTIAPAEATTTGVEAGTTVTATYSGAKKVKSVKAKKKAPANVAVTSITLNKTATEITVGQTETLSVTEVLPANATDPTYTWKTSDETKATVDQNGVVTAVAAGTVTIYAEANDGSGVKGNCAVTVTPAFIPVTAITLNKTETLIMVGSTETLSVTAVAPDNATDKTYTWKTSDASKATVDQDGKVTAVAAGTVTIYAEANDGSGVEGDCTVTVTPATITVTWNNDDITGSGSSFTKDGVTIDADDIDFADKNFNGGGTFTTDLGNFTKIEVTTTWWNASGSGWSGSTWTGNASSVSFSGDIMGQGEGNTKFVFTIELTN